MWSLSPFLAQLLKPLEFAQSQDWERCVMLIRYRGWGNGGSSGADHGWEGGNFHRPPPIRARKGLMAEPGARDWFTPSCMWWSLHNRGRPRLGGLPGEWARGSSSPLPTPWLPHRLPPHVHFCLLSHAFVMSRQTLSDLIPRVLKATLAC